MGVYSQKVSVGTAGGEATRGTIAACPSGDYAQTFYVNNYGAATLLLGDATVGTTAGYPLASGGTLSVVLASGESLYGVGSGATCEVRVLAVTGSR